MKKLEANRWIATQIMSSGCSTNTAISKSHIKKQLRWKISLVESMVRVLLMLTNLTTTIREEPCKELMKVKDIQKEHSKSEIPISTMVLWVCKMQGLSTILMISLSSTLRCKKLMEISWQTNFSSELLEIPTLLLDLLLWTKVTLKKSLRNNAPRF